MINTSNEYKNFITEDRMFSMKATITLEDGTVLDGIDDSKIFQGGMSFDDATSGMNEFQIGSAIIGKHKLVLDNSEGDFDTYEFANAEIVPYVGLELSETTEYLKKGVYTVDEYSFQGDIITLECLDNMHKFEKPFSEVSVSFPIASGELLRAVSIKCGVSIATTSFTNSNFVIEERPSSIALSCLDIVAYIAQLSGSFAKCNTNGALELKWYDMSAFEQTDNLDGGAFDNDTPYSTGDHVDGGDFTFSETEHYDGGTLKQMDRYHHFYFFSTTPTVAIDDVVITGIQVENTTDYDNEYLELFGTKGYVLNMSNNPLIQSKADAASIANSVGAKIVGMRFRPFSANILSDPSIEAGDPCYISVRTSRGYNTYQSFITMQSYTVAQNQNIECNAETVSRKNSTIYSAETKAIVEARKQAKQEITAYDLKVKEMTDLITNGFGLFKTEAIDDNGGIIYYMHDQPTIDESEYRWFMTTGGIISQKKVLGEWQTLSGVSKDGNALYNIVTAFNLEVGNEIQMAPDATINWGNIDAPSDLAHIGDIPTMPNYITSTKITQTTIESPTITAGTITGAKITGGSITSDTSINVTTDVYVGNNIIMGTPFSFQPRKISFSGSSNITGGRGPYEGDISINGDGFYVSATDISLGVGSQYTTFNVEANTNINGNLNVSSPIVCSNYTASTLSMNLKPGSGGGSGNIFAFGNVRPSNGQDLGGSTTANRWSNVYIRTGAINESSDMRLKDNITDVPKDLLRFFSDEVKPKMFEANGKTHFGYIAQDVERALYKYALDKVGFENAQEYVDKFNLLGKDESYLSLVYNQVAVLKEVEMQDRIDRLESQIEELKGG